MFPKKAVIRFDFPARGNMPALKLFWHDGLSEQPKVQGVPEGEFIGDLPSAPRPQGQGGGRGGRGAQGGAPQTPRPVREGTGSVFNWAQWETMKAAGTLHSQANGSLFMGDKGMLTTGTYGEDTRLIPVDQMKDYVMPQPILTRSPGHYHDWIRACKGGAPSCSNFDIASPFVEWMLLGVIALRVEGKLEWDPAKMRITNNATANQYLKPYVRKGWDKLFPGKLT
jgi:hypothetical protein